MTGCVRPVRLDLAAGRDRQVLRRRPRSPRRLEGPNYNVAPTQDVYAVLENGGVRRVEALHWGLIPFWAKDAKVGNR